MLPWRLAAELPAAAASQPSWADAGDGVDLGSRSISRVTASDVSQSTSACVRTRSHWIAVPVAPRGIEGARASACGASVKKPTRPSVSFWASPSFTGNLTFVNPLLSKFGGALPDRKPEVRNSNPSSRAPGQRPPKDGQQRASRVLRSVFESASSISSNSRAGVRIHICGGTERNASGAVQISSVSALVPGIGTQKNALASFRAIPRCPAPCAKDFLQRTERVPRPSSEGQTRSR